MTKSRSNATAPNAKGTLVVGNGTDASTTLAVASTAGYVLTVDSAEATGLKWAAAAGGGKVLQVVNATYSTQTDTTSGSASDLFSASITPASSSNKVLVIANMAGCAFLATTNNEWGEAQMNRNNGVQTWKIADRICQGFENGSLTMGGLSCVTVRLDEPASTSAVTYKMQFLRGNGTGTFRMNSNNAVSSITLLEIGA